jgi:hypothetical protein
MAFDLSVDDKNRDQTLTVGGSMKNLTIAGKLSHPVAHGDRFLEVHLTGDTPYSTDKRTYLHLSFQRFKSDRTLDPTGFVGPIEITARSAARTGWEIVHSVHLTTFDQANPDSDGLWATYGVAYRVEAGGVAPVLRNRILKAGETA